MEEKKVFRILKDGIEVVSNITDGVVNKVRKELDLLPSSQLELQQKRLEICKVCELYNNGRCDSKRYGIDKYGREVRGCGCIMEVKTLAFNAKCPLGKW